MKRKIHSLQNSKDIIEPFHSELVQCIQKGFDDFVKINELISNNSTYYVGFQPRTKACIIHDMIRAKTLDVFSGRDNLDIGEYNKVFGINIRNKLFVRFKKMDRKFGISAYQTPQHKKYLAQKDIIGFPNEPTFLFAGYIPNHSWTSLDGIYLACWNGDVLEWYDEAGNYSYEQFSLDFSSGKNEAYEVIEKRVRLKKGMGKNKGTGTDNN